MNVSALPAGLADFLVDLSSSPMIQVFLATMTILFGIWMVRSRLATRAARQRIYDLGYALAALDGRSIEEVNKELTTGTANACFRQLGLGLESSQLARSIHGSSRSTPLGSAEVFTSLPMLTSTFAPDRIVERTYPRSLSRAPALLLTLGVAGTFLGLTIGVSGAGAGLASTDLAVARKAMSDLLDGAKLAFLTSLAGLTYSTLLSLSMRNARNGLLSAAAALQDRALFVLNAMDPDMRANVFMTNIVESLEETVDDQRKTEGRTVLQMEQLDGIRRAVFQLRGDSQISIAMMKGILDALEGEAGRKPDNLSEAAWPRWDDLDLDADTNPSHENGQS